MSRAILLFTWMTLVVLLACMVALSVAKTSTNGDETFKDTASASTTQTFRPVADAQVDASRLRTNFGTSTTLGVDARPRVRSYLRFRLPELPATVRRAELFLWARSGSTGGFAVHPVMSNDWRELRITYANAPRPSSAVTGSSGPFAGRKWVTADVSSFVTGPGTYSLALTTTNEAAINLASRESVASRRPNLRVDVNDAPNAAGDALSTGEDTTASVDVLGNDTDADGDVLTITGNSQPPDVGEGSVICSATNCTYTPNANFNGTTSFTYTASDGYGGTASATVEVSVTPVNDPPSAVVDTVSTDEDMPTAIDVASNDSPGPSNESDQTLMIDSISTGPSHGIAEIIADGVDAGKVRYTPDADYHGADLFTYKVCDSGTPSLCSGTNVDVSVAEINDAPVAKDDTESVAEDGMVVFDPTGNDSPGPPDEAGQTLGPASITAAPLHGTAIVPSSGPDAGKVRYTPDAGYTGSDSFDYEVCDDGDSQECATATVSTTVTRVIPTVETAPVPHSGDAADDPAIWVNPSDPARSTIIGTDKLGGIAVYDLGGTQLQYRDQSARYNNVDLRTDFPLGVQRVALVAANERTVGNRRIVLYSVDPATGTLADPPVGTISLSFEPYGLCMYHSQMSGKFYVFVTSRDAVGYIEQWELSDNGSGWINANMVRSFSVDSQTEGCVADDELGNLYLAEEDAGIWKYAAEPDEVRDRVLVDTTGPSGYLVADVEGLTIAYGSNGTGYLLASSQGNSSYTVYQRERSNAYVRTFKVKDGDEIDGTTDTDGIDVTTANLGSSFPNGLFAAQDGSNTTASGTANQNYKLVPLQYILEPYSGSHND